MGAETLVGKGAVGAALTPGMGGTLSGEISGAGASAFPGSSSGALTGGSRSASAPGSPDHGELSTGVPASKGPGGLGASASPAPVAEPARPCEWCGEDLPDDARPDRRYCDSSCRARAAEENKGSASVPRPAKGKTLKSARRRRRRANRQGVGTRIYILPDELHAVTNDLAPTSPQSERFKEKLQAAGKRLESRAA